MKEVSDIRVVKSIADQIREAPVETVVIAFWPYRHGGEPRHSDTLVKTGMDGYQAARKRHSGYLHKDDVDAWVDGFDRGTRFYFVHPSDVA